PWCGQGHIMYRVAHAGRTGYNQRTEYNKQILKILLDGKEANPISGLHSYGLVKGQCLLVKGSVSGARKRLVILQKPMRPKKHQELPTVLELVKE
ncbi:MAG: 50S ribosomal protein L3, partial [Nanoarchaeota archaeon]|nr:50S ribosomal protein L3 [Nanoarchaeota archaeon]